MKIKITVFLVLFAAMGGSAFGQNNARMLSTPNSQTGTSYVFVAADTTRVVTFNNAGAVAASLPNGATFGFGSGTMLSVVNLGAGQVTITCSSCTINGAATLVLSQNQGADIYGGYGSPAVNYISLASPAGSNIALQGGNNTFTGTNTNKSSDATLYIDSGNPQGWAGSDIGAWLNAAYAGLPATGGRIRIASSASTYNMSTAFSATVAGKPVLIEGDPGGAVTINWTPTSGTAFTFDTRLNANQHPVGMGMRDLVLTTSGAVSSTGTSLGSTNSAEGYEFQRLKIENFITGVTISSGGGNVSFANMFYNVVFRNLTFGIVGTGNSEMTKIFGGSFFNVGTGISGAGDFIANGTSCDDPGAGGCIGNAIITWVGGHFENPGGGLPTYINSNGIVGVYGGTAWDDCVGAANPVAACTATNSTSWFKNTGTDSLTLDGTELLSVGRAMATNPVVDYGGTGVGTLRVYNKSSALLTPLFAASALQFNQVTNLSFNASGTGVNVAAFQAWKVPENGGAAPGGVAGQIICYGDATAHALKCSYNNGSFLNIPQVVASGTTTLTVNAALAAVTSQAANTTAATGALTTDAIEWSFATAPTAGDSLCIVLPYLTAGNVNFVRTNPTAAAQNVSALVINWRILR